MDSNQTNKQPPNCYLCRHFFITYEPAHPYGCRAMGFKSSRQPCEAVFANSGMPCQMFEPRPAKKKS